MNKALWCLTSRGNSNFVKSEVKRGSAWLTWGGWSGISWYDELERMRSYLMFVLPRPYWRCYYSNTDAVIYVVDSSDRDRMGISKSELVAMLEVDKMTCS